MSSGAAVPKRRSGSAPVTFHSDPGGHEQLGCPNCGSTDELVEDVEAEHVNAISVRRVRGVTFAEVTITTEDVEAPIVRNEKPVRVRCIACRWSYQGPHPAERLVVIT